MSKVVLGKGLGALIPAERESEQPRTGFMTLSLDRIAPNPMQPRQEFNTSGLTELAQSLKQDGLLQPVVVRKHGSTFTIIAGERRYRAARLAGMTEVPVVVLNDIDDTRMLELALIENIHRQDLNPIEQAEAFRRLLDDCKLTQQQLSERIGKSRAAIANSMRILSLPEPVREMLRSGQLTEGHARALLTLESPSAILEMADRMVNNNWSVREAEHKARAATKKRRLVPKQHPAIVEIETELKRRLGTSVKIQHGLKRGKIEIEYYGNDDLERIWSLLRSIQTTG